MSSYSQYVTEGVTASGLVSGARRRQTGARGCGR